jgi:hypothetical protein
LPALTWLATKLSARPQKDGHLGNDTGQHFVLHEVDPGRFTTSQLITRFQSKLDRGALPAIEEV